MQDLPTYTIVMPARDEERFIATTLQSLMDQRHLPTEVIVVDDGSLDSTADIAASFAAAHDYISVLRRPRAGKRARGAPIVQAFNAGLAASTRDTEFVVKLDSDLYLPPHYFEWVAATFAHDDRAGVVGGLSLIDDGARWQLDSVNVNTVPGPTKAYRRTCLSDIGGLQESMGWDGIDEYAARARGWTVRALSELTTLHYAQRGSKQSWRQSRWEEGRANHFMGYRPSFMVVRTAFRMLVERPVFLGGLVLGVSYLWHLLRRADRVPDSLAIRELRNDQARRMRAMIRLGAPPPLIHSSRGPAYFLAAPPAEFDPPTTTDNGSPAASTR